MSMVHVPKPNSYHINNGPMGQGYSGYGDTRSSKVGFAPMSNYDDGDWASGPKYRSHAQYQEKPGWPSDVGFHDRLDNGGFSGGSFHPSRAPGYPRHDTGAWQHQTPGLSSGSGLGSGSRCPRCGTPSYGQGDEWGSNMRDPYGQAQRRFSRCSSCGYVPTTGPYSQPAGAGPMSPVDDFYDQKPFGGSFSNHHSRDDWQQYPGGGVDSQFNNNNMAFPQPNPPMDTFDHRPQRQWGQGSFSSPDAYDFEDSYPTMDADAYSRGFGNQGLPVGGHSHGFPDMGMSGTSRRRPHTPYPRQNILTSIHYSERVYHRGNRGGMGSRSYGGRYDNGNDIW